MADPERPGKFYSVGRVERTSQSNVWRVTELPVGVWRNNYKIKLAKWVDQGRVVDFVEQHREEKVCFQVTLVKGAVVDDPLEWFQLKSKDFSPQLNLMVIF